MEIKTDISQRQSLSTRLSPQQVRFVRLLEMTGAEFEDAVRNELDENPALEAEDETVHDDEALSSFTDNEAYTETSEQLQAADYRGEDDIPSYLLRDPSVNFGGREDSYLDYLTENDRQWPSLIEYLGEQLDTVDADSHDVALARYLTGYLDSNGRLSRSLTDIAEDISLATGRIVKRADLLPALDIIRYQLDPPGVGASDLRECLLIQLQRRQPKTLPLRIAEEIIDSYFDLFTLKHFDKIQTALGVDKEALTEAIAIIRSLDPKPGSSLSSGATDKLSQITPDFFVQPDGEDSHRFTVVLNSRTPNLAVEQSFLVDPEDKAARMFVRRKREEANTFIGLARRRSQTLLTVMEAIVRLQTPFFQTEDPATLKPMILDDISRLTGLDRSVISRATSGKYVATPGALYPLKIFFNDNPFEDSDTSSTQIIEELKKIISAEDPRHPFSDRILTEKLNKQGFALARRTVTKYREKLGIPVARLRKETL